MFVALGIQHAMRHVSICGLSDSTMFFRMSHKLHDFRKKYIFLNVKCVPICGNKMPAKCNRWFLLQILLLAQHVSGTIMPIIRSSKVLYRWSLPVVFGALVYKLSVWRGAEGCVSGLWAAAAARKPDT